MIEAIWVQFLSMLDIFKVKSLVVLILLYFGICVITAIRDGQFRGDKLAYAFDTSLVPLYGGCCFVFLVSTVQPEWKALIPSMWGVLGLALFGLIVVRLKALGLPIPSLPWMGGK